MRLKNPKKIATTKVNNGESIQVHNFFKSSSFVLSLHPDSLRTPKSTLKLKRKKNGKYPNLRKGEKLGAAI